MEDRELKKNQNQFDIFSTRNGCNNVKRYLDAVLDIIYDFEGYENLANILHRYVADELIQIKHIPPIIAIILIDKYKYHYASCNLENDITDFDSLIKEFKKWKAVDLVFVYFHPELGIFPLNPKNKAHWSRIKLLQQSELITLYTGRFQNTDGDKVFDVALEKAILLLQGHKFKTPSILTSKAFNKGKEEEAGEEEEEKAEAGKAPSGFFAEESPFYGIPVTNNQFHNGNVEAWKKIIRSYEYTFPNIKVIIYYNKEVVRDIDSLFQWGKIKPGTVINVKVIGKDLRNKRMSALVYHLKEGASPYFERYIQGNPRMILKLFGNV